VIRRCPENGQPATQTTTSTRRCTRAISTSAVDGPHDRIDQTPVHGAHYGIGDFGLLLVEPGRPTAVAAARPLLATLAGLKLGFEAGCGRDHRCRAVMHAVDDLGVIDPTQIVGGDPEVGVPELAFNHDDRHPLARHLNSVRVTELMGREPATHPRMLGGAT